MLCDVGFMIVVPIAIMVYSKKQRSNLVVFYFYVQFFMALYAIYVRWCNHTDSRPMLDSRDFKYQDTDSLRWVSYIMTSIVQVYQI